MPLNAVLSPVAHSRDVMSVPEVDSCPAQLKSLPVKLFFSSFFSCRNTNTLPSELLFR